MGRLLWTQKQDFGPRPRWGHAMTFDSARARTLLFGGRLGDVQFAGDTWGTPGSAQSGRQPSTNTDYLYAIGVNTADSSGGQRRNQLRYFDLTSL